MNKLFVTQLLKTSTFVVSMLIVGSFLGETVSVPAHAQAQPAGKRKFGPGQNVPRGIRPQGRAPQQQRQAPKPVTDVIGKEGKWVIECDKQKPTADGTPPTAKTCGMSQIAIHKTNKRLGLRFILTRVKQGKEIGTMMQILAPIGIYLPTGVALEVDGSAAGRVPFSRCNPSFCIAFAQVRKETLAKLKKGSKGKFLIYEAPGVSIPLDLDLGGFSAAFKILDKTQQ